jgi:hypothetical protein
MVLYNAPYTTDEEHAAIDHTGIPGVGGGSGGGLTSGLYAFYSAASFDASPLSGLQPPTLSEVANTTDGAVTFDALDDAALIHFVTAGFYSVTIFAQWNIDATIPETGQRQVLANLSGSPDTETAASWSNFRTSNIVGGALADDDSHLLQNVSRVGHMKAGCTLAIRYSNGDALNSSTVAGMAVQIVKLG